jgi:hypothetical protein
MKKIKKKMKKRFKKISIEKEDPNLISNHCYGCQKPIEESSDAYLLCNIHKYNTEMVLDDYTQNRFSRRYYMLTSCNHKYHYKCLKLTNNFGFLKCLFCKNKFKIFLPLAKPEDSKSSSAYFPHGVVKGYEYLNQISNAHTYQEQGILQVWGAAYGCVEQSLRLVKTIQHQRLERNILPCLKSVLTSNYYLKIVNPNIFKILYEESEKQFKIFSEFLEIKKELSLEFDPETICVESMMIKILLCKQTQSIYELEDEILEEEYSQEIITSMLESNFEDIFSKMIILKLLQKKFNKWDDFVNTEIIVTNCYDLLCLGCILYDLLDPSKETVLLPESVEEIQKSKFLI